MAKKRFNSPFMRILRRASFWLKLILVVVFLQCYLLSMSGPIADDGGERRKAVTSRCSSSWLAAGWCSFKRWWTLTFVLGGGGSVYPRLTKEERELYLDKNMGGSIDFEYSFPTAEAEAYLWYAIGAAQLCSALTAMLALKQMNEREDRKAKKPDYLLVFVHVAGDGDEERAEEEYAVSERLVAKWERDGGQAEEVEILKEWVKQDPTYKLQREVHCE